MTADGVAGKADCRTSCAPTAGSTTVGTLSLFLKNENMPPPPDSPDCAPQPAHTMSTTTPVRFLDLVNARLLRRWMTPA